MLTSQFCPGGGPDRPWVSPVRAPHLQEALGVLQQVESTVAAVVLLRNSAAAAPDAVRREETRRLPAHLPLHLQVAGDSRAP